MEYGSPFYLFMLCLPLIAAAGIFFFLRKKGKNLQKTVILILSILNMLQHILKPFIYPGYSGTGFSYLVSAYNMCALLILLSPFVLLGNNRFLKNFVFFVGTVAGLGAIALPHWYIGLSVSELGWEYGRFYLCHSLLFLSSVLPLLLNLHAPSSREFWQIGLGFLGALCVILLNNVVFISIGLFPGTSAHNLYDGLLQINPCLMMGPPPGLTWFMPVIQFLTPDVFLGQNPTGHFAPILWYAIPLYLAISILSLAVFALWNRKRP